MQNKVLDVSNHDAVGNRTEEGRQREGGGRGIGAVM